MNITTTHTGRRCTLRAFPYTKRQRAAIWLRSVLRAISIPPPKDRFLEVEVFKGDPDWDQPWTQEIVTHWSHVADSNVKPPPKTSKASDSE